VRYLKVNSSLISAVQPEEGSHESGATRSVEALQTPGTGLMAGIRNELFQIEMEHKKCQISQAEYQKAKVALDRTLKRALKHQVREA
jgi:hypothetical protein